MFIVEVIPITRGLKNPSLTYFTAKDLNLGALVTVPLRSKNIFAIVIQKEKVVDMRSLVRSANFELRNIHTIHEYQIFNSAFLMMSHRLAQYYAIPTGTILSLLLPKAILDDPESAQQVNQIIEQIVQKNLGFILQQKLEDRIIYYKTRARELMAQQSSLVIVCPSVQHAEYVHQKISEGISNRCFLLHGKTSKKEFSKILTSTRTSTEGMVFIGTASLLALAPRNTYEYIIEQSSSDTYLSIAEPKIDLRLAVEHQARALGAQYVHADFPISVDTWHRALNGELNIIEPVQRAVLDVKKLKVLGFAGGTEYQSETERLQELSHTKSKFHPLHYKMLEVLKNSVEKGEKIFCFVPRKGKAPQIICNDCGQIACSKESKLPYSLYVRKQKDGSSKAVYVCPSTGEQVPAFSLCQFCNGTNLKKLGVSTENFHDELTKLFPDATIRILDRENIKTKKAQQEITVLNQSDEAVIWVGTSLGYQLLSSWDQCLVVSLSPLFAQASYRNEERVLDILTQLQEKTRGTMYLQDRQNIESVLPIIKDGIHSLFIKQELEIRKELSFPPFSTLISIEASIPKMKLQQHYREFEQLFSRYQPSIMVHPDLHKDKVRLVVLLSVSPDVWSIQSQDSNLKEILLTIRKQAQVYINPKNFVSV